MLELLRIRNLALIDDVELELSPGLNALTGETGAGKSFILRAINFIVGEKMPADLVRPGAEKASVEALFLLDGELGGQPGQPDEPETSPAASSGSPGSDDPFASAGERVLRRELLAETGRSRFYVDDRLSSQDAVRNHRQELVVQTSQHAQQRLLQPAFQARLLDDFLPDKAPLREKDEILARLRAVLARRREMEERVRDLEARRELLEFQRREIEKVEPKEGEEEELLARKTALAGVERARECAGRALDILHGAGERLLDAVGRLARELDHLSQLIPDYREDRESLDEFRAQAQELASRLRRQDFTPEDAGEGPADVEAIESRLWELTQLKRKLRRSLDEIVHLRAEIEDNLSFLDACGLDMQRLDKEERALSESLAAALARLGEARRGAAKELERRLEEELRGLGFSEHVTVRFEFAPAEAVPGRADLIEDRARLYWIPNPGQSAQPLDKIASGGELSRFLLAIVSIASGSGERLPTLIFDEVDTGIGGLTLTRVGERIRKLAERQQVILISHWPQLAALADRHFLVRKEVRQGQTYTTCSRLRDGQVLDELSRMAGGGAKGEELARKLIEEKGRGLPG